MFSDSLYSSGLPTGEFNLDALLQNMEPILCDKIYVFATVENGFNAELLSPLMTFQEREGTTLIVDQTQAQAAGVTYEFPCKMITLNIHSSLDAVGFLARITQCLAKLNMGVNPVSGYYHDHLFVPESRAQDALAELKLMSTKRSAGT